MKIFSAEHSKDIVKTLELLIKHVFIYIYTYKHLRVAYLQYFLLKKLRNDVFPHHNF